MPEMWITRECRNPLPLQGLNLFDTLLRIVHGRRVSRFLGRTIGTGPRRAANPGTISLGAWPMEVSNRFQWHQAVSPGNTHLLDNSTISQYTTRMVEYRPLIRDARSGMP